MLSVINELCRRRGITRKQLEQELNFGKNSMAGWGRYSPSIDKVAAVADYFNVSVDQLLGREPAQSGSAPEPGLISSACDAQLLGLAHQLNEEGQSRLLDYAEDLVIGGRFPLVADKAASA